MIDARRWVLVEAWLALGLRIEWGGSWRDAGARDAWMPDDETRLYYLYSGHGVWTVRDDEVARRIGYPKNAVPVLSTETLRHELAHYLAATPEQRERVNFAAGADEERATLEAEKVIDAMLAGADRIAAQALRVKG